jgi:hypothetical protein
MVALKPTEKQIYPPAPPVHYNPPTVNGTCKSGDFFWRRVLIFGDTIS